MENSNDNEIVDVTNRIQRAKTHVNRWKTNIERWRKLYDMEHYATKGKAGEVQYCLAPETKVLTSDLRWVPVDSLQTGDGLVGFDEYPDGKHDRTFKETYVIQTGYATLPSYRITLNNGVKIVASENHKWLVRYPSGHRVEWMETSQLPPAYNLIQLSHVWEEDKSWEGGYLSGALDGEGSLHINRNGGRHVPRLNFAQRDNAMLSTVVDILDSRGIFYSESTGNGNNKDVYSLFISRRADVWKILGMFRPPRLMSSIHAKGLIGGQINKLGLSEIESVEYLGSQKVVTLQTESKTLLAEGYASHNSDPTYTNTVDLSVGIMLANKLRWHAYGFEPSYQEQKETGHVEKLLDGIIMINDEREELNQLYQLYLHFCRDGGAAIYSVFDREIASQSHFAMEVPDEQEGSKMVNAFSEIPLRVQVIDPESIITLPGGPKRWLGIGRTERRSVLDIEVLYNIKIPEAASYSQEQKSDTYAEFVDWWDYVYHDVPLKDENGDDVINEVLGKVETERRMVVRNTVMFWGRPILGPRIMPGYEDLAYTIQFFKPSGKEPASWHSILKPLESSVSLLERSFNRRAHQIDVYTGLPIVTKTQLGRAVRLDPGLYNHVSISPDESIEFPDWRGNPPDLNAHMEFLRSRIQQSGFSDVMFGSGASQVAGYALSQLGDQNRIRLEQPITHLELLLGHWAKKALKLLHTFAGGSHIRVYGQHRGKDYFEYIALDDLRSYSVRAEIRPSFPNEQQRKTAMASQIKGMVSDYTIMERYLDIEQPEDEEQRKLIQMVSQHPAMIQYAVTAELTERAKTGDTIAAKVLTQMESGGLAGQPGRPKEPNNPEQPTGLQSPTGQPVPQALGEQPGQSPEEIQNAMASAAPGMMSGTIQ